MTSPNNNLSVLPWYTSLDKQNAKKWYAFGNVWPLVMPTNRIIPYQFVVPFTNVAIAESSIISLDTKDIYDGQSSHTLVTRVDYTVVKSNGFAVSLPEGRYYAKIDFANGVTYYSEVFTLVGNISDYVKIQYWNDDILVYNGGEINYEDEFKFEMYLCTTIGKPEYSFEEEVTKRLGYKFPELQVSNKLYKFTCIGPEYLCDAMRLIRLSDYIKIVSKDDSYNALTFSYDAKWETQGDLASIEVEFETDTIIQKLSSFNRGQREGFYNALLVDINEALLFDENTVALYYDEYRSSTRAVDVEGKLIRELELITEVGENSQIVVDTGQGPAVRMNLYELIKNFIKRDSNEIIEGLWTFKKGLKTGNDKDGEPTGEITENGYLKYIALIVKDFISSEKFVSGLLGEGFKVYEKNDIWYIECDNLTVRQVLTVFEMIISKIRAVNGGLVVSPGNNTIKSVSETDTQYVLEVEDDIEIAKDDFIRHQVFSTSHAKNYWVKVINVAEGKIYTNKSEYNGAVPAKGDEIITMGNATNSKRQGLIYITAAEDGHPRIEILEGVKDKTLAATNRTVLGNLDDIQDSAFEDDYQPSGSGLYCDNAFLRGIFILRSGKNVETEIDAAQKAAQEAASKAANAEKTANDAKDRLNKWADDGFISPAEKLSLIQEGQDLKAEKLEIVNDATKYTIDTTSYIAAYNDYLTQLQYYTQAEPENIEVLPAFEQAQTKYYTQRTAILNAISAKAKELVDAANATADAAKKAADAAKTAADAAKINADKANSLLADIANDNKLTAQEKQQTKKEWDVIVSEKPKNDASADKYGVSKTSYGNAYNTLSSYITPLLSSLNTTSDITGTDFRAKFKAYYDARTDLLNAISAKAKELVDVADKKIESVKTELSAVDGKITLAVKTAKEEAISASKTYTNSEIKVVKDQIALKVDSATVDALTGRVTTAESRITQNANNISLKVSASEATDIANSAVNNLQIGGRNYSRNTAKEKSYQNRAGSIGYQDGRLGYPTSGLKKGDNIVVSFEINVNIVNWTSGTKLLQFDDKHGYKAFYHFPQSDNKKGWLKRTAKLRVWNVHNTSTPTNETMVSEPYLRCDNASIELANNGSYIKVRKFKVEIGNKATDWSLAPEDTPTEESIKTAKEEAISASKTYTNSEIKVVKDQIALKVDSTTVDALTGRVTTAESRITQNANNISLKVSASEATDIANSAVNNLQIGGRNYSRNTAKEKSYQNSAEGSIGYQDGRLGYPTSGLKKGDNIVVSFEINVNIVNWTSGAKFLQFNNKYNYMAFYHFPQSDNKKGWLKRTAKLTVGNVHNTSTPTNETMVSEPYLRCDNASIELANNGSYIKVRKFKVEIGNKATDWSLAPEDVEDYSNSIGSNIQGKLLDTGIDIDAKTVTVTASSFKVQNNAGTAIAVFKTASNGNPVLQAPYIDVDNLSVKKLDGATGSFKSLTCKDSNGNTVGTLTFDSSGRLWFDGDMHHQGTKNGRSLRYYMSDVWVRGAFACRERIVMVVQGSYAHVYAKGASGSGTYIPLTSATSSNNERYYNIPMYSPRYDYASDLAGLPVDTVIFKITSSTTYRYNLGLAVGQRATLINANNNYNNIEIYSNGNKITLNGGSMHVAMNVSSFCYPSPASNLLGRGILFGGNRDNDW